MRRLQVKDIYTEMLHEDSGSAAFDWFGIGLAALLFLVMTGLEGLIYSCCGRGFLQP